MLANPKPVVDQKGDVFPCEPLWQAIGNVRDSEYDVGAILGGEAMDRFRREHLKAGGCNCTWGCAMHSHISTSPRYLPRLAAEATRIAGSGLLEVLRR